MIKKIKKKIRVQNQQKVWDAIASRWYKYKVKPAEHTLNFLKRKKGRILDLGSGAGRNLAKLENTELYLTDFSPKMLKLAKKRAKERKIKVITKVAPMEKLPYKDNFFDYSIAIASFHCLNPEQQIKAAKELFRVLKPGALAEIAVWNKNTKRFKNAPKEKQIAWEDKGKRYYYLFDENEIHNLFKKQGFTIKKRFEPRRNIIFILQKPKPTLKKDYKKPKNKAKE